MPPKKRTIAADAAEEPAPKAPRTEDVDDAPATGRALRSKNKEAAAEEPDHEWITHNKTLLYTHYPTYKPCTEIAAFDMDGTLVTPKSGRVHPQGRSDWKWLFKEVTDKLKALHAQGKAIVIFTNQGGIGGRGWDQGKADEIMGKISDLSAELGIPLLGFIATSEDIWRKPQTAMWDFFVDTVNKGVKPDLSKCIFVGDAAGRAAGWKAGVKKDFSCTDRKFGKNVGITFKTPEEYFLGEPEAPFDWGAEVAVSDFGSKLTDDGRTTFHKPTQEMVIFCGFPAAGKSTFAKRYFIPHGYVHVNRDTLKTPQACLKLATQSIEQGKSVVVDNTMPKYRSDDQNNSNGRKAYLDMAAKNKVSVRCFHFQTSEDVAKHLNMFRERQTNGAIKHVPRIGYATYKKAYEEPALSEGYEEIVKVNFVPKFDSKADEDLFHQSA